MEQVLTEAGFEILQLKTLSKTKVQAWVDRDPGGVGIDELTQLTRAVRSRLMDEELDPGDFELEINSPGLDRLLIEPAHFQRFAGSEVKLRAKEKDELGQRNFTGKLLSCVDGVVTILFNSEERTFPLETVDECRLVPAGLFAGKDPDAKRKRNPTKSRRKRPKQSR